MSELLFSYGTLQKEDVQLEVFSRLLRRSKDVLAGYKLSPVEITDTGFLSKGEDRGQLTLVPTSDENDRIEGSVFEISAKELLAADKYEPENYKRVKVRLQSGKEAWAYIIT
jgi:gamma-glutamylcyclotransferase (GGCT)/AIG2-like uncharacterized protein YtfP